MSSANLRTYPVADTTYAPTSSTKFGSWHQAHARRKYTPTFDAALRAMVDDPDAQEERVWAYVVIRSWGIINEPWDYAVDDNGNALGVTDVARALDIAKQRVSEYVSRLSSKNRLHLIGRKLYPVDDPSIPFPLFCPDSPDKLRRKGEERGVRWRAWEESDWLSSDDAKEEEEILRLDQEIRLRKAEINQRKLARFKAWEKSQTPRTNASETDEDCPELPPPPVRDSPSSQSRTLRTLPPPILIREVEEEYIEQRVASAAAFSSLAEPPPPTPTRFYPFPEQQIKTVTQALSVYETPERQDVIKVIADCRYVDPNVTAAEITVAIHEKGKRWKGPGLAFFYLFVPGMFPSSRPAPAAAPIIEETTPDDPRRYEDVLADDKTSEEEKSIARRALEAMA